MPCLRNLTLLLLLFVSSWRRLPTMKIAAAFARLDTNRTGSASLFATGAAGVLAIGASEGRHPVELLAAVKQLTRPALN